MFIPGSTVAHTFTVPFQKSLIDTVIVSYRQKDMIILEKFITSNISLAEVDEEHTRFTSLLTEEESLLFQDLTDYSVQVNILFDSGSRAASDPILSRTGSQHIRQTIDEASEDANTQMYIDEDGYLVYIRPYVGSATFAIDSDGYLVLESEDA